MTTSCTALMRSDAQGHLHKGLLCPDIACWLRLCCPELLLLRYDTKIVALCCHCNALTVHLMAAKAVQSSHDEARPAGRPRAFWGLKHGRCSGLPAFSALFGQALKEARRSMRLQCTSVLSRPQWVRMMESLTSSNVSSPRAKPQNLHHSQLQYP